MPKLLKRIECYDLNKIFLLTKLINSLCRQLFDFDYFSLIDFTNVALFYEKVNYIYTGVPFRSNLLTVLKIMGILFDNLNLKEKVWLIYPNCKFERPIRLEYLFRMDWSTGFVRNFFVQSLSTKDFCTVSRSKELAMDFVFMGGQLFILHYDKLLNFNQMTIDYEGQYLFLNDTFLFLNNNVMKMLSNLEYRYKELKWLSSTEFTFALAIYLNGTIKCDLTFLRLLLLRFTRSELTFLSEMLNLKFKVISNLQMIFEYIGSSSHEIILELDNCDQTNNLTFQLGFLGYFEYP